MRYCVGGLFRDNRLGDWYISVWPKLCEDVIWINYEALSACVSKKSEALDAANESEALDAFETVVQWFKM